jgi:Cdc6-like AAA superfamily ATPase
MTRINFKPYNSDQLIEIVQARLLTAREGLKGEMNEVIVPDAVKFAAKKVASITGDARRVLDICRSAINHDTYMQDINYTFIDVRWNSSSLSHVRRK